jgi:biopolymer transport protein ExbB
MKKLLVICAVTLSLTAEEPSFNILTFEKTVEEPQVAIAEETAPEQIETFFESKAEEVAKAPVAFDEAELENEVNDEGSTLPGVVIDLKQVFSGSPTIYTILMILSVASVGIWFYTLLNLRTKTLIPENQMKALQDNLLASRFDEAEALCKNESSFLFKMVGAGIQARNLDASTMLELMNQEGRRASSNFWQKLTLLNDVAIIAPMLGLLGTVLGMFYAFYDLNRSMESISALFDGLGISVGTTVGGLVVAIVALILHSMTKYRLVRQLARVENEAKSVASIMNRRTQI